MTLPPQPTRALGPGGEGARVSAQLIFFLCP